MEENALFCNIATLISKDLLVDSSNNLRKPKHFQNSPGTAHCFPLLESEPEDEAFQFFLRQQKAKHKLETTEYGGKQAKSCRLNQEMDINLINDFTPGQFEGYLHLSKMSFLVSFFFK